MFQKACYWPLQGYVDSSGGEEEDSSELKAMDSSQWDSRGEEWLPFSSDSSSDANFDRVSDGSSEIMEADADSDGSQNNTNPLSEKNETSEKSEFRTKKIPVPETQRPPRRSRPAASSAKPESSSAGSTLAKPKGYWMAGHWDNGQWIPGKWVPGGLRAQGSMLGPNGGNTDVLDSAPERWQALFIDEFIEQDTMVAAVTNVILQLDGTSDSVVDQLLTETIAEATGECFCILSAAAVDVHVIQL